MTYIKTITSIILLFAITQFSMASDSFNVEDYGLLPDIRSVAISPDGKHYAFIKRGDKGDQFIVINIEKNEAIGGVDASKIKARSIYFATNDHVIMRGSKTLRSNRFINNWEHSGAFVYNLKTNKVKPLLKDVKDLFQAQSGLGRIVGINRAENVVYMPAYIGRANPSKNLMRVNLKTGRAIQLARGNEDVVDWFVDENGKVLAREEYIEHDQLYRVLSKTSGKWKTIYTEKASDYGLSILAVSKEKDKLVLIKSKDNHDAIYSMSLSNGEIKGPLLEENKAEIDRILTSRINREYIGVLYSGLLPNYQYQDKKRQQSLAAIQNIFPNNQVEPLSVTADGSTTILKVSGNKAAGDYLIFDSSVPSVKLIGSEYPAIKKEHIANVKAISYKARDDLSITAILTEPVGIKNMKNLPMIVMPHGGPEIYDSIRFDWWAQYFARKGYLVLQPNFRGSIGFGYDFRNAGRGKWGKEMQDDISDGVADMVNKGYADPSKVCIMGASYGGYAALAGGAFTPDLYRCVIAVAGVSDLPKMLSDAQVDYGKNHWVVSYWEKLIGDSKTEREKLKNVSPVNFAQNFKTPLLMLHGRDDTVVPIDQSKRMLRAMEKAGQQVELITLKGEDHWLSGSNTRLELLQRISDFLDEHNPVIVQ